MTTIRLRLTKTTRIPRQQLIDVELMLQEQRKADYVKTIRVRVRVRVSTCDASLYVFM